MASYVIDASHPFSPERSSPRRGLDEHMKILDKPPAVVFKYMTKEIFSEYFARGHIRLGLSSEYRAQWESGAGFADAFDGVRQASFPKIGQSARTANEHYLMCVARSYSYNMHARWLERPRCGYHVCVALDGLLFFDALADAIRTELGKRLLICGNARYGDHSQTGSLRGNIFTGAFLKPAAYSAEDEYRLAAALAPDDPRSPLDITSDQIVNAIRHTIWLDAPAA